MIPRLTAHSGDRSLWGARHMTARLIGVYIDFAGATTLAEARICRVVEAAGGKMVMQAIDDDGTEGILQVVHSLTADQLQQIIDAMHAPPVEQAS